jgi:hypothetical protein
MEAFQLFWELRWHVKIVLLVSAILPFLNASGDWDIIKGVGQPASSTFATLGVVVIGALGPKFLRRKSRGQKERMMKWAGVAFVLATLVLLLFYLWPTSVGVGASEIIIKTVWFGVALAYVVFWNSLVGMFVIKDTL